MANLKLLAIKIGDELKYDTSLRQIDRIAEVIFDFKCLEFPKESITSERAQLIYDWVMTLNEQQMPQEEKLSLLKEFVEELAPEDNPARNLFDKNEDEYSPIDKNFQSSDDNVKQHITQHFHGNIENFALGDINNYSTTVYFNALLKAIEESNKIPDEDKENLIDKIKNIANNPYVSGISAGLIVEAIKTGLVGK